MKVCSIPSVTSALAAATALFIPTHGSASPPDKSGVKPSDISLPSGAGSIEGLGQSFEPQLNTGGSSYGVSITVPPGRAGLAPSVHLGYNSFAGNGITGIGWSLEFMSVTRQTDKGFPAYDSGDTFVFGGEELVPLNNAGRDWRCENERSFQRLRQIDSDGDALPDAWEVTERNGTKHMLGRFRGQNSRWSVVEHPEKGSAQPFNRTYSWMLDATIDLHGNRIEYEYVQGSGLLYVSRITYAQLSNNFHEVIFLYQARPDAFDDYRPSFSARLDRRLTRIEVRSQGQLVRAYNFAYNYEPGDLLPSEVALQSTYLDLGITLLKRVVQVDRSGNNANYLPPLVFTYSGLDLTKAEQRTFAAPPELDLAEPDGRVQLADLDGDALPDLFATTAEGATKVQRAALNRGEARLSGQPRLSFAPARLVISSSTLDLAQANTVVHDPKGKGLVDVSSLEDDGGNKWLETFGNRARLDLVDESRLGFGQENLEATFLANPPAFVTYGHAATRQMDVNFDKRGDFVNLEPAFGAMRVNTFFINRSGNWVADHSTLPASYPLANTFQSPDGSANPNVHLADMNGDRLMDLVCFAPSPGGAGQRIRVSYWPLSGLGQYADERTMATTEPDTFEIANADLRDLFLDDITGDGLADIIVLDGSGPETVLSLRVNIAGQRWSLPYTRAGLPRYAPRDPVNPTIVRLADLNANGSLDLLFRNTAPDTWGYIELLPQGAPSLIVGIDNGLGLRTAIVYGSAAEDEQLAREANHPWRTFAPIALQVVRQIQISCGVDLNGDGRADTKVMGFRYRDPYYDAFEREFRGFAFAQRVDYGDDFIFEPISGLMQVSSGWNTSKTPTGQKSGPSLVSRYRFYTGAADQLDNDDYGGPPPPDRKIDEITEMAGREEEPLKGLQLVGEQVDPVVLHSATDGNFDAGCEAAANATTPDAQTTLTPDAYVYNRTRQTWVVRRLYRPTEPLPYFADQNANGQLEDYRSSPAVPVPAGRFADDITVLPGNGRSVTFVFAGNEVIEHREANGLLSVALGYAQAPGMRTTKVLDFDDYGNQTVIREFGLDHPSIDDERVTTTTYAHGGNALSLWIIDRPDSISVTDENGAFVSRKVHFYDAEPFVGVQGQIQNRALLHRTIEHIDLTRTIQATRTRYDAYGNAAEMRDPRGNIRRREYDRVFRIYPITETMVIGGGSPDLTFRAEYDVGFGVVTRSIDFNGNVTTYRYDSFARLVSTIRPGDSGDFPTVTYEYQPCDPIRGRAFVYDAAGNLGLTTVPLGSVSRAVTRQREISGDGGQFITVAYADGRNRSLASIEEGESAGTWVVKNASSFNLRGQPQSQWLPYRISSSDVPQFTVLWPSGRPPELDGTNQIVATDLYYDPQGRQIRSVKPPEMWAGERYETTTENLPFQVWTFDEEDRRTGSPHVNTPHIAYSDGLGRLIGMVEVTKLDNDGRSTSVTNHWLTRYEYDLNDQLIRITDSQNNIKTMRYDGLKRKTFVNDPDQGVTTFIYDDASNLEETTDAKGQRISYTYDGANRIRTEEYHDENSPEFSYQRTPDVAYFYDQPIGLLDQGDGSRATATNTKGFLAYVLDASGEEHTSYDERGRVEWIVKRIPDAGTERPLTSTPTALVSYTTRFTYDSMDRVRQMRYPDNDEVSYLYNNRNLTQRIVGGLAGNVIAGISYRSSGQQEQIQYGNGVRTFYHYDPRLRLVDLETISPPLNTGNQELIRFHYEFDGVSNVKQIQDRRNTSAVSTTHKRRNSQVFSYDDLYRLTRVQYNRPAVASANGGEITYRYDRIGNLQFQSSDMAHLERGLSVTDLGIMGYGGTSGAANRNGRQSGDPPGPHGLSGIQGPASSAAYPYDASGNMTEIDGLRCTWDFRDRLVAAEDETLRAEYLYDYSGRRIIKRVRPAAPGSLVSLSGPQCSAVSYPSKDFEVREYDQSTKYVFNGETRVATITGSLSANTRVQRLRLCSGWNLCSVAVGGARLPSSFGSAAFRWNSPGNNWVTVSTNDVLAAGKVLWIHTANRTTICLTGTYTDPTNLPVATGCSFQPGAGLEVLRLPLHNSNLGLWNHDHANQIWQIHSPPVPEELFTFPDSLAPGAAIFVNAAVSTTLEVPEAALRIRYYHQDHLGSSSVITDADGALVEEIAYYPFGVSRHQFRPRQIEDPYTFTQKESDRESGFHYFEARYLAGRLSRFASADPRFANPDALDADDLTSMLSEPQKQNLYAYVLNNPLKYHDPTGLENLCYNAPKNPSPSQEVGEGIAGLICLGAEVETGKNALTFVKHAYEGSPTPLKVVNTLTAPIWLPVVIWGSMNYELGKEFWHIGKGTVRGAVGLVKDSFTSVPAQPPPNINRPVPVDEPATKSSSVSRIEPPPPPRPQPKYAPAPPRVQYRDRQRCWTPPGPGKPGVPP
jgi:RHS repeat-associated protein